MEACNGYSLFFANKFAIEIVKGNKNMEIHYQVDNGAWQAYSKPIEIFKSAKIIAEERNSKRKDIAQKNLEINFHKGLGKKVEYNTNYNTNYAGNGTSSLVNGISGSNSNFRDGQWQGFYGKNVDITVDLKEKINFNELKTSFFQYHLSWIIVPKSVEYLISDDGVNFKSIHKIKTDVNPMKEGKFKEAFVHVQNYYARYVRVIAENYGFLPKEHPAAGSKSWLFIDEFSIK